MVVLLVVVRWRRVRDAEPSRQGWGVGLRIADCGLRILYSAIQFVFANGMISAIRNPQSAIPLPIQRLATCRANTETTPIMTINDPLIHPALLDPRQWAEVDLYDATANIEREAIAGAEHHTPDRKVEIKHLKLDLRFDHERRYVEGSATFTLSPINDGLTHFELDIAEMAIKSATLTSVEERGA